MSTISTSTSAFYDNANNVMGSLRSQMDQLNTEIATGKKLETASSDPAAAAQLRALSLQDAEATVYTSNANAAQSDLNLADTSLTSIVNTIQRATELATQAANGTLSASNRASIATELQQIQGNLLSLANSRDSNGNALFGGAVSGNAYTTDASGNVVYAGTATANSLDIGPGSSVTRSVTGNQVFSFTSNGTATNLFSVVQALTSALSDPSTTTGQAQSAAQTALDGLKSGLDTVTSAQTIVGSRLSWIQLSTQGQTAVGQTRTQDESNLGDTDVATAYTKLQQLSVALQASQAIFSQMSNLSLFNHLK